MQINTTAVSKQSYRLSGQFNCCGIYQNAINFSNEHQHLISFHREGFGLSPMGWQFSSQDFDLLHRQIGLNQRIEVAQGGIVSQQIRINAQNVQDLKIAHQITLKADDFAPFLALLSDRINTGLYGRLNRYRLIQQSPELVQLQQDIQDFIAGNPRDWQAYLGKGLGLTPSSDDMLVGILFVLYSHNPNYHLQHFFEQTSNWKRLTTPVSAEYLYYAVKGIFSSQLITLNKWLAHRQPAFKALHKLVAIGHHSGADTLLGMWLGTQIIQRINNRK